MDDIIESVVQSQRRKGRKRKHWDREPDGGEDEEEEAEEEREEEEEERPAPREEEVIPKPRTEGQRGWLTQEEVHCFRRYAIFRIYCNEYKSCRHLFTLMSYKASI